MAEAASCEALSGVVDEVKGYQSHWGLRNLLREHGHKLWREPPLFWIIIESDWMEPFF